MDLSKYQSEDIFNVLHELNRIHNACMKGIEKGSKAELDYWDEFISEIKAAHINLEYMRRKKIDADLNKVANEEIRRNMF
ncbi:hypothetical protein [Oceanobacillus oncorhynchi]|uniref:hypothetical protein n=1 Tax=Oceanobacillus oncorhynchi TaxID=545501 RepID=UPI0018672994|nr:hypothetical protein [Oceanobacillus oncorhynchi]